MLIAVPILGCFLTWFLVPDSPLWLVKNGKYEEADKAIAWLGRDEQAFICEVYSTLL